MQALRMLLARAQRRWRHWLGAAAVGWGLFGVIHVSDRALGPGLLGWLSLSLWTCLGLFAAQLASRLFQARQRGELAEYLFSMSAIADVMGVVAVPLALLCGASLPEAWLAGLVWILKLAPASAGMRRLSRVIAIEREPLTGVACLFLIVLLLSAAALFALERHVQPAFETIPRALWWSVVTLTTTGYGDVTPQTEAGRVVAGLVMIAGLMVLGLWIGIMATGFAVESRRQDFLSNWELVMRVPLFRTLDAPSIAELARILRRRDVNEHSEIYDAGDDADCIYFIVAGRVEIALEPMPVLLGPGEFFGEHALLEGRDHSTTVRAVRPTTLLMLDVMDFRTFTAHHPDLAAKIGQRAQERRRAR